MIGADLLFLTPMAAAAAVGVMLGMAIERKSRRPFRPKFRPNRRSAREGWRHNAASTVVPLRPQPQRKGSDAADQLRTVMSATYDAQRLLNVPETRLFRQLHRLVEDSNPQWHVMAQVSLGEVLRSSDLDAFLCINSKRVDLLLIDEELRPRHAIEYQGSGHHQGNAAARDAVKKEALRRAGIGYHEVVAGQTTLSDLRTLVGKLVTPANLSSAAG